MSPVVGAIEHESQSDWQRKLAERIAEVGDRISAGESVELAALAAEHPAEAEAVERLLPAMQTIAGLRASDSRTPKSTPVRPLAEPGLTGSLGDFQIVRVIGRGGMGVVYEAIQLSLNRRVALKILPMTAAEDPSKLKRFQIEAQAAALLNHPHIVPVYLVGAEKGAHFFAMQLIAGRTLADHIAERRLARLGSAQLGFALGQSLDLAQFAAEIGKSAALALHHAHAQGILHRDVKPSNLLIEESGRLWVADFGLARIAGECDQTSTGDLLGTPRYMSPEQVIGARTVVDHRTDVYSLGATLYELITLEPAFAGVNRVELILRIAHEEPRAPRQVDRSIPRDLETIILKAMAKEPAGRYATAADLADDLARFLDRRPIHARPPGAIDRAAKWSRRNRPTVVAAGVCLSAIALGLIAAAVWSDGMIRRHNTELSAALVHAERVEASTRRLLYDSQLRLAQQSSNSGQVEFAQELLEKLRPQRGQPDLRGFEWNYLWRECHRDVTSLVSHEMPVSAMVVSPDDRTLVSSDFEGVIVVEDLEARSERMRFQAHDGEISTLAISPDGQTLLSVYLPERKGAEVKLWNVQTGRFIGAVPGLSRELVCSQFSADSCVLGIAIHPKVDGTLQPWLSFWNFSEGSIRPAHGLAPLAGWALCFSPDGRWLATIEPGAFVVLRNPATGQELKRLPAEGFTATARATFSADGRTLGLADACGAAFWNAESGQVIARFGEGFHTSLVLSGDGQCAAGLPLDRTAVALVRNLGSSPIRVPIENKAGHDLMIGMSSSGRLMASVGRGIPATVYETSGGRVVAQYRGELGSSGFPIFERGDRSLVFSSSDGRVRSWHFDQQDAPIAGLGGHQKEVWALTYTPDGSMLVSASDDHSIKFWDARDGRLQNTLMGHDSLVMALTINRSGTVLASASYDKTVRLWELPSGKPRLVLRGHTDRARAVAFAPDGKALASAGADGTVRLWDPFTGSTLWTYRGHSDTVRAVVVDPSGRLVLSCGDDRTIKGVGVADGREQFSLACPKQTSSMAFSPDGTILAVGDDWGNVSFWDVGTWSRRSMVKGSDANVWGLAFSPDGRTLAAACDDDKVRLWDPVSGQVVLVLDGHPTRVNAVVFSPDGHTLASADHSGKVKLWQAAPGPKAQP